MSKEVRSPVKIIGILFTMLLLFSINIGNVFSAGNPARKPTKTPTPTQTLTSTITPSKTPTPTFTSTPITFTPTFTTTPGPGMQLLSLSPSVDAGLYTSYSADSSPGIGISTNDLYVSINLSGITTGDGDFSKAIVVPAIKNTRNTTFAFYWSAYFQVTGFSDIVIARWLDHEFSGSYSWSGAGLISPNGTWRPDLGIIKKNLSTCHNCSYTLYTTFHFSEKNPYASPFTSTPLPTVITTHTPTNTPTLTPTNTFVPGTPHNNGSGICWSSQASWENYTVYYDILTSYIPGNITKADWVTSIESAAQTWNNVAPSGFTFARQIGGGNTIRYEVPINQYDLAASAPPPSSGFITSGYTKINPNYLWDVNNTSIPGNPGNNGSTITYNLQNVVTHELGHWLLLIDINDSSCADVTMDYSVGHGELIKIDLHTADENAINWQYP